MAEARSSDLRDVLGAVLAAAPECIREGVLLKAVNWRVVSSEAVADMLGRIAAAGVQLPLWLAEALLVAGHPLGGAVREDLPPVLRVLATVNAANPGDDAAELKAALAALIVDDAATQGAPLDTLLRRLCDKGHAGLAAPLAIRVWPHASQGGSALQEAMRQEIGASPPATLRLLCLSNADVLAGDVARAFATLGLAAHVETRAFAQVWPELMQPNDNCDARVLVLDAESLFIGDGGQAQLAEKIETLVSAIERTLAISSRPLIVTTIPAPLNPVAGYVDGWHPTGLRRAIDEVNRHLYDLAQRHSQLSLIDADVALAAIASVERGDPKLWFYGQLAFTPPASRALAVAVANAWRGLARHGAKVLALDLDNTLWGGIVGEDGVTGVVCGTEFPGNAYRAFQQEALRLKSQGLLLAILSKNDPGAIDTFASRSDMPLKADDFAAMRINWSPKPDNLRDLARELNLGLDSFVFIDDSPHERDAMRRMCPEVLVPELPDDSARRPRWLRGLCQTWPMVLTSEDTRRSDFYAAERKAVAARATASSFEDFLAGLDQKVILAATGESSVARIAQMHARTNQYNLTTKRFDEAALRAMIANPQRYAVLHAQVTDTFGDHGIAIAAVLRFEDGAAHIDSLLMSCRVIGRRVEQTFLAGVSDHATRHGAQCIYGAYLPTGRNGIARDFYASAGFECIEEDERRATWLRTLASEISTGTPSPNGEGIEQGAYIG